jgi:hypothetical protein
MTVCMYRYIHATALYYWSDTTGMTHLKTDVNVSEFLRFADRASWYGKKGKVHPCTGTEVLYRPYGP